MTGIIGTAAARPYAGRIMTSAARALADLQELQRRVERRTDALGADPAEVLAVGRAVLAFAEQEQAAFFPLLPLLDPAARAELEDEHHQLVEDLQLLEWLIETSPESPDVGALAEALARRMRTHIARDGRLLARAMRMAAG
jgi:hypothetical protein